MYFLLRVASGSTVKLASCKNALRRWSRCKYLWFILRGDLFCLILCHFVLVFFSPLSIAINSLGEER